MKNSRFLRLTISSWKRGANLKRGAGNDNTFLGHFWPPQLLGNLLSGFAVKF